MKYLAILIVTGALFAHQENAFAKGGGGGGGAMMQQRVGGNMLGPCRDWALKKGFPSTKQRTAEVDRCVAAGGPAKM
jgi:hypothetical protein